MLIFYELWNKWILYIINNKDIYMFECVEEKIFICDKL